MTAQPAVSDPLADGRRHRRPPRIPESLAALLGTGPRLPGRPACLGRYPAFDADVDGESAEQRAERHERAIAVCWRCPVRDACATAASDLGRRALGVWAGQVRKPTAATRGARRLP